jgi:hypothetical protein
MNFSDRCAFCLYAAECKTRCTACQIRACVTCVRKIAQICIDCEESSHENENDSEAESSEMSDVFLDTCVEFQ